MAECECELSPQSQHAGHGVVEEHEDLIRVVYSPLQIDPDGSLIVANFNKDEFQRPADGSRPNGFSNYRASYSSDAEIGQLAKVQMAKMPNERREAWSFKVSVAELRQPDDFIPANGDDALGRKERLVCVVDAALAEAPSHAELWGARRWTASELRRVRHQTLSKYRQDRQIA